METSTQDLRTRRWVGRLARIGLVLLAIVIAGSWIGAKISRKTHNIRVVKTQPVPDEALASGDLRIYNGDSTVDLVLRGHQVLAGLSPKTVAKIQSELDKSRDRDTSGLGAIIASSVKSAVAGTIGIHAAYPVSDIRDMRYEGGQLVIERNDGSRTRLFGDAKVDHRNVSKTFREDDAQRFIAAVKARRAELEGTPSTAISRSP